MTSLREGKIARSAYGEVHLLHLLCASNTETELADGECVQTIVHPAISVWSVSSMPNGDVVSGSSDGIVRVFSASEDRWATVEELKQYDEQVASQALPS